MKKYLTLLIFLTIPLWGYRGSPMTPPGPGAGNGAPPYMGNGNFRKGMPGNVRGNRMGMNGMDINNLLKEVKKVSPYVEEKMNSLVRSDPKIGGILTRSLNRAYGWYLKLQNDPDGKKFAGEFWKLSVKEKEFALKIRDTSNKTTIKKLKRELNKTVSKLFDLRQKAREIKINRIEQNLDKIKADLKQRVKNKKQIVQDHIDSLLGIRKHLSW